MNTTTLPISEMAKDHFENSQFMRNPYFLALADSSMDLANFQASQAQFYHAVKHCARPMSLLIGRMPNPAQRLAILHNIVEEHGEFEPARFHEATFRGFLKSVGTLPSDRPEAPVDAFNVLLSGVCSQETITKAVCCIGIIEYAFAEVSALIGRVVVERGWVAGNDLVHYSLHAEIDLRHAAELFEVVEMEPAFDEEEVRSGLKLGLYAFDRLYRDLSVFSRKPAHARQ